MRSVPGNQGGGRDPFLTHQLFAAYLIWSHGVSALTVEMFWQRPDTLVATAIPVSATVGHHFRCPACDYDLFTGPLDG
jgi:hypothetical protein